MGTFHSICVRILRKHYSSSFTIYDTADTTNLIKRIIKDFDYDTDTFKASSIRYEISDYKNRGKGVHEYLTDTGLIIIGRELAGFSKSMKRG
ncbi:MAG: UvrD-helicase domain-containing protein [Ezakiella massiliensis]